MPELTTIDLQIDTDSAFQLEREIKHLRKQTNEYFWQMVDRLAQAKEIKIWERLGHDSWASWLAQEGLDLRAETVNRYLRAYKAIKNRLSKAVALPLFGISRSKVLMVANRLTSENSEELISKAQNLSYSDLKEEVAAIKELEDDPPEYNPRPKKPIFAWCSKHGQWRLVRGNVVDICVHD